MKLYIAQFAVVLLTCSEFFTHGTIAQAADGLDAEWQAELADFDREKIKQISGIYPHLTAFNRNGECGIGAVVPWAGRLWWITYPPHMRQGSSDKLYSIDESLKLSVHPESVGGTHAARMIHRPTNQLLIGPYVIDAQKNIRALNVKEIPGRYTAWAAHLTDPEHKAYLYDMEGPLWEIDLTTLAGERLFVKPAPGWHGKGAYTGQNRLVVSNNGESSAAGDLPRHWELPQSEWTKGPDAAGVLAEYDGKAWNIVERKQFVDITGPGGIEGNRSSDDPLWAMGWDRRSVLLKVCDGGKWSTYRLPKASHAMDPTHGWYTEWPRIREISDTQALLCMHGMFYEFPRSFSASQASGIRPICSHLRYVPDFCMWNDQLVLAADDTSIMQNPIAGQSQSNLWFGSLNDLRQWGPGYAFGGPWLGDAVTADTPSDPYLFAGFRSRMVHFAARPEEGLNVSIETADDPHGQWTKQAEVTIPASGYLFHQLANDMPGEWIRFTTNRDATISAYLHYGAAAGREHPYDKALFAGLLPAESDNPTVLIRAAGHNRNLQVLVEQDSGYHYYEVDKYLDAHASKDNASATKAEELLKYDPVVTYDDASAIVTSFDGKRYRLPLVPGITPTGRDVREVQSERTLAHVGNIFYEVPRGAANKHDLDFRRMRPIAAHEHTIHDFASWRGLLVLSGANPQHAGDGHVFALPNTNSALWYGCVDDLWRLGKPRGEGGPWKNTATKAGVPSDPYLMTGFDSKSLELSHTSDDDVIFTVEIDYSNRDYWKPLASITVSAGKTVTFDFPSGYSAHWVRLVANRDCSATAFLRYE